MNVQKIMAGAQEILRDGRAERLAKAIQDGIAAGLAASASARTNAAEGAEENLILLKAVLDDPRGMPPADVMTTQTLADCLMPRSSLAKRSSTPSANQCTAYSAAFGGEPTTFAKSLHATEEALRAESWPLYTREEGEIHPDLIHAFRALTKDNKPTLAKADPPKPAATVGDYDNYSNDVINPVDDPDGRQRAFRALKELYRDAGGAHQPATTTRAGSNL